MKIISIFASITATALLVTGCTYSSEEVGSDNRDAVFGVSTAANLAAQSAGRVSDAALRDLNREFAAETTDTVTFAFDSWRLDDTARAALNTQIVWLKANPTTRMTIVGHTDLVGSQGYNKGLGLRRARAVMGYLRRNGISRKRLVAIESRGELDPIVQTTARERRNRRAVTMVSGFISSTRGLGLDGVYAARVYDAYQAGDAGVGKANASAN